MTELRRVSRKELEAEASTALPAKEVISLLDLNVNVDLALDLAAPIDLAVAANLNVALPIDAAVAANVLSIDSTAQALAQQQVLIDQSISGEAIANAPQNAVIDQGGDGPTDNGATDNGATDNGATDNGATNGGETVNGANVVPQQVVDQLPDGALDGVDAGQLLNDGLLNVDVNVAIDADIAAPIAAAVAANANVAAPIDAAVAANVLSIDSQATAVANQTAVITQTLDNVVAEANAEQDAVITQ